MMDKKILPLVAILIVLAAVYICFEYFLKPNPAMDAKKFDEFMKSNLKSEYRSSSINLVASNVSSRTLQNQTDLYIYSYSWDVLNDTFRFSVNYNDKKSGIDAYTISVFTPSTVEKLDKEAANSLSEKYFAGLPSLQWECAEMQCLSSWEDGKSKKGINIFMPADTFVWLWMLPPESESR